jgi:cell division septum initiation protein DivIVA
MDVSPQELRSSEIKDAWRGYNRDDVDDLLERAAVTIESLSRQVQEAEVRAPADPDALPTSRDDAEMLQRTLLLAQRAADEEVSKAQAQARKLVEESEARAQALVGEAEATARRIAEGERRRLEDEIRDLTLRRDQLAADADALEDYVSSYRERVRTAIEHDLERLGSESISAPTERPALADVEPLDDTATVAPAPAREREPERVDVAPATPDAATFDFARDSVVEDEQVSRSGSASIPSEPRPNDAPWPPPAESAASTPASASVAAPPRPVEPAPAPVAQATSPTSDSWLRDQEPVVAEPVDDPPAPWERATAEHAPFSADTPLEANAIDADDDLDDDAFFASLREAVRDDAPLGPLEENDPFFDEEPAEPRRGHFRRRR